MQPGLDYHSFANIEQFRVTRLELDLRVDMPSKVLDGVVGLRSSGSIPAPRSWCSIRATSTIHEVSEKAQGVLGATSKDRNHLGKPAVSPREERSDTGSGARHRAAALQPGQRNHSGRVRNFAHGLRPAMADRQDRRKHKPFLYTKSEPIGARSWIPLQDTPLVRVTYKAVVHTRSDAVAVMSAKNDLKIKHNGEYHFDMPEAIPSYLIALAVGDLAFKETGPRSGVYAREIGGQGGRQGIRGHGVHDRGRARNCSAPIAGIATTSWCCRRLFRWAVWKTRGYRSSRRP